MRSYHENILKLSVLIFNFALVFICFMLFVPFNLYAEGEGSLATYLDSITTDEDGVNLMYPSFVTTEPFANEVYVIDGKLRIIIYTSDFFPIYTLSKKNGIEAPHSLTVDSEGNLYVAQGMSKSLMKNRISVFNACLKWERDIILEGFEGADSFVPSAIALDKKGNLYVSGIYFPGVLVLDKKGNLLDIMSVERDGEKVRLTSVTIDKTGRIFLLSEETSHTYVYDENKKFLFEFGEKGGSPGKLSRPKAVAVDEAGRMYVVDYMRHAVAVYEKDGTFFSEFGGMGWGEGWLQFPTYITIDTKGRILISDTFNHRIEVFKPK